MTTYRLELTFEADTFDYAEEAVRYVATFFRDAAGVKSVGPYFVKECKIVKAVFE